MESDNVAALDERFEANHVESGATAMEALGDRHLGMNGAWSFGLPDWAIMLC